MSQIIAPYSEMTHPEITMSLVEQGFEFVNPVKGGAVYGLPSEDWVIRVSSQLESSLAFAQLCQDYKNNPHFPAIHDYLITQTDVPVFISVFERLATLDDFDPRQFSVIGGPARAMALLIEGDEEYKTHQSHIDVHKALLEHADVRRACLGIINKIEEQLSQCENIAIFHQSGFLEPGNDDARSPTMDEWYPDNVMYRLCQETGTLKDMVFTDPFSQAKIDNSKQRDGFLELAQMQKKYILDLISQTKGLVSEPGPSL